MLKGIKNIILDLGGVIINLNQELTYKAFQSQFPNNYNELFKKLESENFFDNFETGHISSFQFITTFKLYNPTLSDKTIINVWNSMLLDIPEERILLINKLSKNYSVFLLSNTNTIHYNYIDAYYQATFNKQSFASLFKKAYLSYNIGYRKPNATIFEFVLNDSKLNPQNTLFIDDSIEHIKTASSLGIKSVHLNLNQQQTLNSLFNEY